MRVIYQWPDGSRKISQRFPFWVARDYLKIFADALGLETEYGVFIPRRLLTTKPFVAPTE